jgi:hypothetical protein
VLSITSTGDFSRTTKFFSRMSSGSIFSTLDVHARRGVAALEAATPVSTGIASGSWDYEIEKSGHNWTIWWTNRDVDKAGTPIVILLQFGHGTGTGGYVQGRDFINPAIRPIFDQIAEDVWKAVTSA